MMDTMNGKLLVIGREQLDGPFFMMSFASPIGGQRIDLPRRRKRGMDPQHRRTKDINKKL